MKPGRTDSTQRYLNYVLTVVIVILLIALVVTRRELEEARSRLVPEAVPEAVPEEVPTVEEVPVPSVGVLAIIIDDFGYRNDEVSDGFLALDARLTFSIIPGHTYSQSFAQRAQAAGKEVIIHMPMESHNPTRGEEAFILTTAQTSAEVERRVERAFARIPQAVGMNNHQGSRATENQRIMEIVGLTLRRLGKYFIDSRTTRNTVAEATMRRLGVPTNRRHVFLDNEFDSALILEQLEQLERLARKNGAAIGIGHAKAATLQVLREQIPRLKAAGFRFEFVSTVVD
jgi:hypothetical protein